MSECVSLLESCLQGALSEVLVEEMKATYGELWTEVPLNTMTYTFLMKFILRAAPHLSLKTYKLKTFKQ